MPLASRRPPRRSPAHGDRAVRSLHPVDALDWRARYAWSPDRGGPGLTVRYFRRVFRPSDPQAPCVLHVSADSRYRLWLNGERVGFGPAKGSLGRYHFETYDLRGRLRAGDNVLAAEVRWFGDNCPVSEVHAPVPGFLLQGETDPALDTPGGWRVWTLTPAEADTTPYIVNAHQFLDHLERWHAAREPLGWREPGFDDAGWEPAADAGAAGAEGNRWGVAPLRLLVPRDIDPLHEEPGRFVRFVAARREVPAPFAPGPGWRLGPGEGGALVLDPGLYSTGFPELRISGGAGREVRVVYAESLGEWVERDGWRDWRKAPVRDDFSRYEIGGYRDTLLLDGRDIAWEPFYWRAFRFILLEIPPGPAEVTVRDASYRLCVHPQRLEATFASDDADAGRIFAVSLRTFRVGAHEIYDDSPYYEQLSYIADTRIEALGSLHLANETRLPRRTLRLFLDTLRPDGLLDARVPCQYARQTIPYFCLHWILMVEDYWRWIGEADRGFVRECLVAVDTILGYFRARLRADFLAGPAPGWNMVDQVPGWPGGEPPAVTRGGSTYLTCLVLHALRSAIRLHEEAGYREDALRWKGYVTPITRAVRRGLWDETAGLFVEGAENRGDPFSQHAQAAAVLSGAASAAQVRRLAPRLAGDPALLTARSMQAFYVAGALEQAGRLGGLHRHVLEAWRAFLAQGVTTWPEYPDPARSDAHAWTAWPAVTYIRSVLGIQPGAPGWTRARLQPQTDGLDWAEGSGPTPHGPVKVSWKRRSGALEFAAEVPRGLATEVCLPGLNRVFPKGGRIGVRVELP